MTKQQQLQQDLQQEVDQAYGFYRATLYALALAKSNAHSAEKLYNEAMSDAINSAEAVA